MRDEPFPIRRKIDLERRDDRREHAADALFHRFASYAGNLRSKSLCSPIQTQTHSSPERNATARQSRVIRTDHARRSLRNRSKCKPGCAGLSKNFPNAFRAAARASGGSERYNSQNCGVAREVTPKNRSPSFAKRHLDCDAAAPAFRPAACSVLVVVVRPE
jgi:hypothetical protein